MLHFNLSWFVFLLNTVILKAVILIQEKYLNRHLMSYQSADQACCWNLKVKRRSIYTCPFESSENSYRSTQLTIFNWKLSWEIPQLYLSITDKRRRQGTRFVNIVITRQNKSRCICILLMHGNQYFCMRLI